MTGFEDTRRAASFAQQLVDWQRRHGRHGLPWQGTRDPYRVWLSEVMLQQTQVQTVLPYFTRFLQTFPTVAALAAAPVEAVMQLWSGLGYYSRARNLHRAAQQVVTQWGGQFPPDAQALATLPGVGRSTANAIAAFCWHERVSILDANVQRVLARYLAFPEDLASSRSVKTLWMCAETLLPPAARAADMPTYTQGLMDLGAMVCTPRQPRCTQCPVAGGCLAYAAGKVAQYPRRTRKLRRSTEQWALLVLLDAAQQVWLQRRPASGIWAQLQAFPVFAGEAALAEAVQQLGLPVAQLDWQPGVKHVLTHKDLMLSPALLRLPQRGPEMVNDGLIGPGEWASLADVAAGAHGVPAPIKAWAIQWLSRPAG
ncbi:hypothetical protein AAV94_09010 [Lampropedia cohaerens]|uniref:Adenine DNA glycosylase n=1 Tax=Lampropedia cohaerens TaxID=1610491 RepID=A0A0U1PZ08_9BURK|nr:A/G-specific adenine glycosylase [Lampropedia cohaerens]KKW67758.1 hypothetical protein AAV94_09010 [Lampropedia cohaerens]